MISSTQNQTLKDIRRLRRSKGDHAVLEGPHLVAEALGAGIELQTVLASPEFLAGDAGRKLAERLPRPPLVAEQRLIAGLADADSPKGLIAVARLPRGGSSHLPVRSGLPYLYAAGLQDPGNLGALARVAEASGAAAMITSPGSVHLNHPRALRASAGSLLRLPVAAGIEPETLDGRLEEVDARWLALVPRGGRPLWEVDLRGTWVVAVGAEGPGLPAPITERAELRVEIPIAPPVESLNATVAAALILFEIARRRRGPGATAGDA